MSHSKSSPLPQVKFRYLQQTTSTNDEALKWLEEGAGEYSLVITDVQTQGRGRLNREWHTTPGAGLAFSVIIKPCNEETTRLQLFSLLGAAAVCSALEKFGGSKPEIKWSNDVLIHRKKVCGILSEAHWQAEHLNGIVLGIGVNVASGSIPKGIDLQFPATCIEDEVGQQVDRREVLGKILDELLVWRPKLLTDEFYEFGMNHLAFRGERVKVEVSANETITGVLRSIARDGSLEIELETGELASIMVGDVHLRTGDESC